MTGWSGADFEGGCRECDSYDKENTALKRRIEALEAERDAILLEYLEHLDAEGYASADNLAEMERLQTALQDNQPSRSAIESADSE